MHARQTLKGGDQVKSFNKAGKHRLKPEDTIERTDGGREPVKIWPVKSVSFKRDQTLAQKYSPCADNNSVDPYVVVTSYHGKSSTEPAQQFNTEWIDAVEKNECCFKMDESHNNVMKFDVPANKALVFQFKVCDHDWGMDDDDFIGKADAEAEDLIKASGGDPNATQLFELKNDEGFSAGDIVIQASYDAPAKVLTLTVIEGIDIVNPDATVDVTQAVSLVRTVGLAAFLVLVYFFVSAGVYLEVEGWSMTESIYFAVATFTTVGYGDLGPLYPGGKLFTCFLALWGIAIISVSVGLLAGYAVAKGEQAKEEIMDQLSSSAEETPNVSHTNVERAEDSAPKPFDFELLLKRELRNEKMKAIWGVFKLLVILAIGTIGFRYIEKDNTAFSDIMEDSEIVYTGVFSKPFRIWIESFYWATITSATVGYGDVYPETEAGMIFSIFYISIGTVFVAQVVSLPTDIYLARMRRSAMKQVLNTKIDRVMFERMDKDGSGELTRLEYLQEMLINLRLVDVPVLNALMSEFDNLDKDNGGTITKSDLLDALREKKLQNAAAGAAAGAGDGLGPLKAPSTQRGTVIHVSKSKSRSRDSTPVGSRSRGGKLVTSRTASAPVGTKVKLQRKARSMNNSKSETGTPERDARGSNV